ncbi:protoporphyrinogen oxidase [Bacillus andreraoultii]|uniref:protoporphyrinogen oxidase n=1 Tax=Bacillus andreraoultii TaxID=1499685 RepID=UPI00053B74DA|nr:protoporphyrinogen oxidase [Bacillus andreraoultii]
METVLVIGGGITGLSAMYELQKQMKKQKRKIRLILAEASSSFGGKIRTVKEEGFIMEAGADSIVARKLSDSGLLKELGLEEHTVYNAVGTSYLYTEEGLKQIPREAVFGIPASIRSLAETTLLSAEGKVEALKDYYLNDRQFTEDDSIGDFLEYYLGKELVEKQIAPVLSGVYSGSLYNLTIGSTLPYVLQYKEKYGSIMKGIEANKEQFIRDGDKKFLSFADGLSTIAQTIVEKLTDVELLLEHEVVQIDKIDKNMYQVHFQNGQMIEANSIILSIPHTEASRLLNNEQIQEIFSNLKASSLISVYLGYSIPDEALPENGTGYLAPNAEDLYCNACTWTSRKWKHTSTIGNLLVRLFYKSSHPKYSVIRDMNTDELLKIARNDIEKSLGITEEPVVCEVTKWTNQMPTYQINHPKVVDSLEKRVQEYYPGVYLAGCSYYGVGIPDCIENGIDVAREIIGE